ncbi:SCO4225 family membrane protein [Streptomyces sp. NPDC051554]|uniref:SCO4225 family membrane protein n=1 Tax=Streptomyces sp. NPDC051554 TaxID=3365656 RepID=UPI0037AE37B5
MPSTDANAVRSPLHRLGQNLRNPFALAYLGVCLAIVIWTVVVTVMDDSGESMAGVVPILATTPGSLVFLVLPGGKAMFFVAVVIGALVNASVIGWCARALKRGNQSDATR